MENDSKMLTEGHFPSNANHYNPSFPRLKQLPSIHKSLLNSWNDYHYTVFVPNFSSRKVNTIQIDCLQSI